MTFIPSKHPPRSNRIWRYACLLFFFAKLASQSLLAQVYPVEVMPLVAPPYPALLADYSREDLTAQRLQVNLLMRDLSQSHRRVRLKVYIDGPGMSVAGSDMPQGVEPVFLDGGSLLRLTNAQLAPYFKLENLPGLSPQVYARPLIAGMYTFSFEVYDFVTNHRLSAKRAAPVQIVYNLPPLLNLPATGCEISSAFPQNVMFNWTPRHMDISNTEYEFTLVELNDPMLTGEAAFLNTPPFYQQTTMASALVYGPAMPPLVQGKRYAWRVQAKPRMGATYTPVFENEGYSPVFTFTYEAATLPPAGLTATPRERYTALATWQGQQGHTSYVLELRQKPGQEGGHSNWYKYTVNDTQFLFKNLRPGYTYECRVTGYRNEHNYATSELAEFTTPAMNPPKFEGCGTAAPKTVITNHTPLENLDTGDVFTVGETPVTVLSVTGRSGGAFSGTGWMRITFLGNAKFAVAFNNIMINTDYQLIAGVVGTTYDPRKKNIVDVNQAGKQVADQVKGVAEGGNDAGRESTAYDRTNITIELNLSQTSQAQYDASTGKLTVSDGKTTQTYTVTNKPAEGQPLLVQDSHGDQYRVDPKTGKVSPMGTPQDPAGIAAEKGKTGVVSFANAPGSKYAIDLFDAAYDGPFNTQEAEIINLSNRYGYRVAAKLMVQGGPDDVVLATVKAPGQFDPSKLVFKTFTGQVWESKQQAGTMNFLVTVKPGNPNGATILMALYDNGTAEPELLGKLKVYTYAPVSKDVVLVPVGGASIPSALTTELADSYKKYGITLNITTEPYPEFTGEISTEGITRLSRYSTSMKALNSQFRLWATQKGTFKNDAQYLFFFKASPSGGGLEGASLLGDMPRGKQFGYLFGSANAQTAAHELGHGIFRLAHTFDSSYGYPENSTGNLMDYKGGCELVKHQWDILHDPGIAGWLDDSEDGQFSVEIHRQILAEAMDQVGGFKTKPPVDEISTLLLDGVQSTDLLGFALDYHFDNKNTCGLIIAEWENLSSKFEKITLLSASKNGWLLHELMDFYAHSNFVELYIEYWINSKRKIEDLTLDNFPTYEMAISDPEFANNYFKRLMSGHFDLIKWIDRTIPLWENVDYIYADKNQLIHHDKMNKDAPGKGKSDEYLHHSKYALHEYARNAALKATINKLKQIK